MLGENFAAKVGMCQKHKNFMLITVNQQNQRDYL